MRHIFNALSFLIAAMITTAFTSCMQEEWSDTPAENEVCVYFRAALPEQTTRAGLAVDRIVCAVFSGSGEQAVELPALRQTIAPDGSYTPRLVKGQRYTVVFWAMSGEAYDLTSLKKISRKGSLAEPAYEVFDARRELTVTSNETIEVMLRRPQAELNIATEQSDWEAAAAADITPVKTRITVRGCFAAYNLLTGEVVKSTADGLGETQTVTVAATGEELQLLGEAATATYRHLGTCYLFTDGGKVSIDCRFYADETCQTAIGEPFEMDNLPLAKNRRTNLLGKLLMGGEGTATE